MMSLFFILIRVELAVLQFYEHTSHNAIRSHREVSMSINFQRRVSHDDIKPNEVTLNKYIRSNATCVHVTLEEGDI